MNTTTQKKINRLNMVSDAIAVFFSYLTAVILRFDIMKELNQDMKVALSGNFVFVAFLYSIGLVMIFSVLKMYGSYRFKSQEKEIGTILTANGIGVITLMALLYVVKIDFSRLAMLLFWIISSVLIILKRLVIRAVLKHYRALGYNLRHVIVVGAGKTAEQYKKDVTDQPGSGVRIAGYVSDHVNEEMGRRICKYDGLEQQLERWEPDELVVALDAAEINLLPRILAVADKEGIHISCVPFFNEYIPAHPTIDVVGETKLINMRATPLDNIGWAALKRLTDIVGSLVLIVLTSPIMLAAAIGVKLSSPGPILFKQKRIGKNKKPFQMWKFRSMRITGTEDTGWSRDEDPRKTRFGSFIRKFSIDELPQFFNVLTGKMSLVGPRPEVPYYVEQFKEKIPLYLVRQQVRPGITGWAQVNGLRGDTSIEKRVRYDIWYIENWSFALDIRILLKTVFGGMINSEKVIK